MQARAVENQQALYQALDPSIIRSNHVHCVIHAVLQPEQRIFTQNNLTNVQFIRFCFNIKSSFI